MQIVFGGEGIGPATWHRRALLARAGLLAGLLMVGACAVPLWPDAAQPDDGATADQPSEAAAVEAEAAAEPAPPAPKLPPLDDPRLAVRIGFEPDDAELGEAAQQDLSALAVALALAPGTPPEIHAYWRAEAEEESRAKTFALKRGMRVRTFLKDQGVVLPRIVLTRLQDQPGDLVDILRVP